LISTEEKVIENGSHGYVYEFEKIKTPSSQDPTIEYRIAKFPANRVESINTYKRRRVNRTLTIFGGLLIGAAAGIGVGSIKNYDSCDPDPYINQFRGFFLGSVLGVLAGIGAGTHMGIKSDLKGVIKESAGNHLQRKPDSISIPAQNFPLEFVWGTIGKSNAFKTQTDERGIVRINLIDDLNMTKFPLDHPLILYIYYLNPESQVKEILRDSLGPEK
jgi:hypothetical protein